MNPYHVLDLPANAGKIEIRAAYRALARRWHPDRFTEGPERDWANDRMAEINAAYRACLKGQPVAEASGDESGELLRIQELIRDGEYSSARRKLMNISTRCAEWNYLFGAVLLKTCETRKALIYLSVAAHQKPDEPRYARALHQAQGVSPNVIDRLNTLLKRRSR